MSIRNEGIYFKIAGFIFFMVMLSFMIFSDVEYRKTIDFTLVIVLLTINGSISISLGTILSALAKIYEKVNKE